MPIRVGGDFGGALVGVGGAAFAGLEAINLPAPKDWVRFLSALIDEPASLPGYSALKCSGRGDVFRACVDWDGRSLEVVCKQARPRGFWRCLASRVRSRRGRSQFELGLELLRSGIKTALPLAWLGRRGWAAESWLITAFVGDLVDLDRVALLDLSRLDPSRLLRAKASLADGLLDLIVRLERLGLSHRDFKASNLMLRGWDKGQAAEFWLIDVDGLERGGRSARGERRFRPLMRLAASLSGHASLTRSDRARFLRAYLRRRGVPAERWKDEFRRMALWVDSYQGQAVKRKVGKLDGYTGESAAR